MATSCTSASADIAPPRRFIFNDEDMEKFLESPAKQELLRVTSAMGKSCSTKSGYEYDPDNPLIGLSPAMASLHGSLQAMKTWVRDFPPTDSSKARFGNPAFRKLHTRLVDRSTSIISTILKTHKQYPGNDDYEESILEANSKEGLEAASGDMELDSVVDKQDRALVGELSAYLCAAFGHQIRLDYGTGHECSFQVFLYSLLKLGCFGSTANEPPTTDRLKAVTLSIWHAYLGVTRLCQTDYILEPAGSHGVWGLDDYHCLPFYFGACQLQADGDDFVPEDIHSSSTLEKEGDRFLYFGCIRYIKSLKKGVPFFESSPMLNDISHLPSWQKVASGLLRLFEGEVLKKRQVVQHFVFGTVFAANWTPSGDQKEAPTRTFTVPSRSQPVGPMVRAPWADDPNSTASNRDHVTRAPGRPPANDPSSTLPPPTRAPWAK